MNPVALHAFNPGPMTGEGNWTWLLAGQVTTLIDAGTGDPRHLDALTAALAGRPLDQVIVTHGHTDHASGAVALTARFPDVRFLKMPWPERDARYAVPWQAIGDGEAIAAGDTTLTAVHTPGHAPDHVCLWHGPSRSLFSADLAIHGSSIYIPSTHGGDLAAYLRSLENVLELSPLRMYPAHGRVIDEPAQLLRKYLSHRRERERQVLTALREGASTADEVLRHIYEGINPALAPVARDTILSHLQKLEREGRVRRSGEADGLVRRSREAAEADAWHIIGP